MKLRALLAFAFPVVLAMVSGSRATGGSLQTITIAVSALPSGAPATAVAARAQVIAQLNNVASLKLCKYVDDLSEVALNDCDWAIGVDYLMKPSVDSNNNFILTVLALRPQIQVAFLTLNLGPISGSPDLTQLSKIVPTVNAQGQPALVGEPPVVSPNPTTTLIQIMPPTLTGGATQKAANAEREQIIQALAAYHVYTICAYADATGSNINDETDSSVQNVVSLCTAPQYTIWPTIDNAGNASVQIYDTNQKQVSPVIPLGASITSSNPALSVAFSSGNLAAPAARYEQGVELIPLSGDAAGYAGDVVHMMARRGIPAMLSNITSVTLAPSTPNSAICNEGQNYFAFDVRLTKDARPLIGTTRVNAAVDGWMFDCANKIMLGDLGAEDGRSVPTTKSSITSYLSILAGFTLFSHTPWAPHVSGGIPLVGAFIDVDPDNSDLRQRVGDLALQRLVDKLCNAATIEYTNLLQTAQTPINQVPAQSNNQNSNNSLRFGSAAGSSPTASTPVTAAANTVNANFADFTGTKPYHVQCNDGKNNSLHTDAYHWSLFEGWTQAHPVPTPLPTPIAAGQ